MKMRKVAFVAGVAALLGMSSIAAADGYRRDAIRYAPVSAYSWSGVYFGIHGGYGWGDADIKEDLFLAVAGVPLIAATQNHDTNGWLGGVQLGAMKQFGQLVVGAEFSLSGAGINGTGNDCFGLTTLTGGVVGSTCDTNVNWLLSGLARVGYAQGRWMVYATGGYAVAGVDHSISVNIPVGPGIQLNWAKQDVADGFAYGGGAEFAFANNVTFGVQYLHYDLQARGEGLVLGGTLSNGRRDVELDTVTARLSYKWGGDCCAAVPLK
jgi:outer membrane immunogenic protein